MANKKTDNKRKTDSKQHFLHHQTKPNTEDGQPTDLRMWQYQEEAQQEAEVTTRDHRGKRRGKLGNVCNSLILLLIVKCCWLLFAVIGVTVMLPRASE